MYRMFLFLFAFFMVAWWTMDFKIKRNPSELPVGITTKEIV